MGKRILSILIVGYWIITLYFLFRDHILVDYRPFSKTNYETILKDVESPIYNQMTIYNDNNEKIGRMRRATIPFPDLTTRFITHIEMDRLKLFENEFGEINLHFIVNVDQKYKVSNFRIELGSRGRPSMELKGMMTKNGLMISVNNQEYRHVDVDVSNFVLSNSFSPFENMPELVEGKTWIMNVVNPVTSMANGGEIPMEKAVAHVGKKEKVTIEGKEYEVFPVKMRLKSVVQPLKALITSKGEVVEQTSPLGILRKAPVFEEDNWFE